MCQPSASIRKIICDTDAYLDITWFISTVEDVRDTVKYMQQEVINELVEAFPAMTSEGRSLPVALSDISDASGSRFIIIIDEWDALLYESSKQKMMG
ncbi:hypothetical protein LKD70_00650 [Ruminococcus sp. CLA-AA-H200]|uniref:AAA-ATPase-like domain-containing protein n=1 Tax=Ruminococcus turbiniformis TaxID=2881258 RepID=A0ABS8FSF3_9FIRM|nr:hypothetical protein [Ruminococcus turbiniformis]MCC2252963.1 hypothetical protein [Ruminococcus turbiniformis]